MKKISKLEGGKNKKITHTDEHPHYPSLSQKETTLRRIWSPNVVTDLICLPLSISPPPFIIYSAVRRFVAWDRLPQLSASSLASAQVEQHPRDKNK